MQIISKKTLTDIMRYNGITVFTYAIHYPQFTSSCCSTAAQSINKYYEFRSRQSEIYCRTVLYPQAVDQARFVQKNQFPFNSYQFLSVFQTTYNKNCISSLYTDQYMYLGGAHGNTTRDSQTWDFCTGKQLNLEDFFPKTPPFTEYIFKGIQQQIEEQMKTAPSQYFDDYATLLRGNFNINGFFIKPAGIVIYYQQYDIAPYVRGIPEFLFPFNTALPMPGASCQ